MAWYHRIQWEETLRNHAQKNSSGALIRTVARICTKSSEDVVWSFANLYGPQIETAYGHDVPDVDVLRKLMFISSLGRVVTNQSFGSFSLYKRVCAILSGMEEDSPDFVREILRDMQETLATRMYPWYARCLQNRTIGVDDTLIEHYQNASYNISATSLRMVMHLGILIPLRVLIYSEFEDSNGGLYRDIFRHTFLTGNAFCDDENGVRRDIKSSIQRFLRRVRPHNARFLGEDELRPLAVVAGYDGETGLVDMMIETPTEPSVLCALNLSLDCVLAIIEEARQRYTCDDTHTLILQDVEDESDEDDENETTGNETSLMYNPVELARGIGKRPDITMDIYTNILKHLPWWCSEPGNIRIFDDRQPECSIPARPSNKIDSAFWSGVLATPHESVFRDFMDNCGKWIHILANAPHRNIDWINFCVDFSRRPFLTLDDVRGLSDIVDWDWESLSRNPSIATPENITANMDLPWKWGRWGISVSPSITPEFVREYWDMGINFGSPEMGVFGTEGTLSENHDAITPDMLDIMSDVDWSYTWNGVSSSLRLTLPWLTMNTSKSWAIHILAELVNPDEELAAKAIQSWWRLTNARYTNARLAAEVEEWWYNPDCKPAAKMREGLIWNQHTHVLTNLSEKPCV